MRAKLNVTIICIKRFAWCIFLLLKTTRLLPISLKWHLRRLAILIPPLTLSKPRCLNWNKTKLIRRYWIWICRMVMAPDWPVSSAKTKCPCPFWGCQKTATLMKWLPRLVLVPMDIWPNLLTAINWPPILTPLSGERTVTAQPPSILASWCEISAIITRKLAMPGFI